MRNPMKKNIIMLACIALLTTKQINTAEIQPTLIVRLYAFKDDYSGNKFAANIPIYGAARKIACPTQSSQAGGINFIDTVDQVFFERKMSTHFRGITDKTYNINPDMTVSCEDEDVLVENLPCLNLQALNNLITCLEGAEYTVNPETEIHEKLAVLCVLSNYIQHKNKRLNTLFYGPGSKFGVLDTSYIPDMYVKTPLSKPQFKELKEAFTTLYNHGIDKDDLSAHIQPTPINLSVLKRIQEIIQ